MAEINDLKKRVALLESEASELRGMVHALLLISQEIIDQEPLVVSSRTAKGLARIRKTRVQGNGAYLRGFGIAARRMEDFGSKLHAIIAPEVAAFEARYPSEAPET